MKKHSQTWEIILLTPLHVGDGESLQVQMDYLPSKKGLEVIDLEAVLESLQDNPKALSDMGRMDISSFIRSYGLSVLPRYRLTFPDTVPNEVRRFIKDAYGRPFLAGSSLKGAIRTALWQGLDRSRLPSASDFRSFDKAVKSLEGQPHNDFLRPLQISDSPGIAGDGNLQVSDIRFFNLRNGDRAGWKDFSGRRTLDRFQDANGIFAESLKSETRFYVKAKLDSFLPSAPVSRLWPIPPTEGLDSFESLARAVNTHSRNIAEGEKAFFARYGQNHVAAFYDSLMQGIDGLAEKPGTFIVRMAWGSGWKGMTGDWMSERELADVRRQKPLGKPGVPVFPKTRRLAMKDGLPSQPLGWVLVQPAADDLFYSAAENLTAPSVPEAKTGISAPAIPKPAEKPVQTEIWENAFVKYTPNDGKLTAVWKGKKAETSDKDLIPQQYHNKLFKKKKGINLKVEAEVYGNAFRLIRVW